MEPKEDDSRSVNPQRVIMLMPENLIRIACVDAMQAALGPDNEDPLPPRTTKAETRSAERR